MSEDPLEKTAAFGSPEGAVRVTGNRSLGSRRRLRTGEWKLEALETQTQTQMQTPRETIAASNQITAIFLSPAGHVDHVGSPDGVLPVPPALAIWANQSASNQGRRHLEAFQTSFPTRPPPGSALLLLPPFLPPPPSQLLLSLPAALISSPPILYLHMR